MLRCLGLRHGAVVRALRGAWARQHSSTSPLCAHYTWGMGRGVRHFGFCAIALRFTSSVRAHVPAASTFEGVRALERNGGRSYATVSNSEGAEEKTKKEAAGDGAGAGKRQGGTKAKASKSKKRKRKKLKKSDVSESDAPAGSLDQCVDDIERAFGKGSIMKLGSECTLDHEVISTGSIALDAALGIGGLKRGRITEVYGPEASGKTTIALQVIAQAQRGGGKCAFIDAEHALDPGYSERLGINIDELLVSQPDSGEQALEIADALIRMNTMDVIVIDSVSALVPRAELEGEMGDAHVGLQARLMSQAMRKLTASLSRSDTVLIFINQIRMKVGVIFGSPEVTSGGNALKFYSSVRLDVRRVGQIAGDDEVAGNRVRITVKKNKLAPPFRQAEFDLMFGKGISHEGELADLGTTHGLIEKKGAWYKIDDEVHPEVLCNGRAKLIAVLEEDKELAQRLNERIRAIVLSAGDSSGTEDKKAPRVVREDSDDANDGDDGDDGDNGDDGGDGELSQNADGSAPGAQHNEKS